MVWTLVGGGLLGLCVSTAASLPGEPSAPPTRPSQLAGRSIGLTGDGATLLVVNSDSGSLTLVDASTLKTLQEIPVGRDPRTVVVSSDDSQAYVANHGSDSVSVVDLTARVLVENVVVGHRPLGMAIDPKGRFLAVAEAGDDTIRCLELPSLSTLSITSVADRPFGLASTPDGRFLLVTHLLSGEVTVLSTDICAPPPTRDRHQARSRGGQAAPSSASVVEARVSTWPNVAPAPSVTINSGGTRAYLPQTMANGLGLNVRFDTTVLPKVSVLHLGTVAHLSSEHVSLTEADRPVGLPWEVALARGDTELWVVNAASNDVSVVAISDPVRPVRAAHIAVGDNPRGLVISPDGSTAYVNNALAGTVSVIDVGSYAAKAVIQTTKMPLPPALLRGKRLFFSSALPGLARARWISCATCHVEAEHDGRTWKLQVPKGTAPGPRRLVTRNTTSLLGMGDTYPQRWSGEWDEAADSELAIRLEQFGGGLIDGEPHATLGAPNQGRSFDLDCLAAFLDGLDAPPPRRALTPEERRGRAIFESAETRCATCHPAPLYTDLKRHDVGTGSGPDEWLGASFDTPTLRYLFDSPPYLHDGRAASLRDVLVAANPEDRHGATSHLDESEIAELVAYLLALPAVDGEPAPGEDRKPETLSPPDPHRRYLPGGTGNDLTSCPGDTPAQEERTP